MKEVRIADLKARLSEHLREVRKGRTLLVMDRQTPIARIVPYEGAPGALTVRRPLRRVPSLQRVPLPSPLALDVDIVDLLEEERQDAR